MTGFPFDLDDARKEASGALEATEADGVEIVFMGSRTGVTRYAGGEITQNVDRDDVRAYVRVDVGRRVASVSTNQISADRLADAAARAVNAARASMPDEDFPGLPDPDETSRPVPLMRWDDATAAAPAASRAARVEEIVRSLDGKSAAGIFETSSHAVAVLSSRGVECFDAFTRCAVTCLVEDGPATGWGEASSHEASAVDAGSVVATAAEKAARGRRRGTIEPGERAVLLEPAAVAGLIDYLAYAGFGAKQVLEKESFLAHRAGGHVAAESVSILDDAGHPQSIGIGFDFEGVPRRPVRVIDHGVARGPVTDRRTGRRLGVASTGHFSGSDEAGPLPFNLVMEPGDAGPDDLLGSVSDGLLVTRFHYINVLDRPETLLTGMTRDGTFRIRGGEIAEAVPNLRFTQAVLDALRGVRRLGRDAVAFAPEYGAFGSTVTPAAAVDTFRFSTLTTH